MKPLALFLLDKALGLLLKELWAFLKNAVAVYENEAVLLSPEGKRSAIQDLAIQHAQNIGAAWSGSLINLGIEAALQHVRAKAPE
jgi:hypothetical protein